MDGQFSVIGNHEEAQLMVVPSIYVLSLVSGFIMFCGLFIVYEECDVNFLFQILEERKVAEQFLLLNTALVQALDKLPDSLGISDEVREQVVPF